MLESNYLLERDAAVDSQVSEFLQDASSRYRKVYFRPNSGNAGDSLINFGFYSIAEKIGLEFQEIIDDSDFDLISDDDILLLSGGGNLVPYWDAGSHLVRKLVGYKFPIALLPQSVEGREDIIALLRVQDTIFLREKISYDFVLSLNPNCKVLLDHDLAFHSDLGVLERFICPDLSYKNIRKLAYILYHYVRSRFKRDIEVFRADKESRLSVKKNKINDISQVARFGTGRREQNECSASWFLRVLSWYEVVETDRLHVFIAGVMLGKKIILHESSYHKIRGVYFSSVQGSKSSSLVSFDFVTDD